MYAAGPLDVIPIPLVWATSADVEKESSVGAMQRQDAMINLRASMGG